MASSLFPKHPEGSSSNKEKSEQEGLDSLTNQFIKCFKNNPESNLKPKTNE